MAAPVTNGSTPASDEEVFQAIDAYPWDEDPKFQAGLAAILGPNTDPEQVGRLTLRARCFYYSRKNPSTPVDFPAYAAWHAARSTTNGTSSEHPTESQMRPTESTVETVMSTTSEPPPYPLTFNQIVELISTGAPIPGIKDIPDTLLEGQSTASTKPSRRKPWEKEEAETAEASAETSQV